VYSITRNEPNKYSRPIFKNYIDKRFSEHRLARTNFTFRAAMNLVEMGR